MPTVTVRVYAELNDFLPAGRRQRAFVRRVSGTPSVKDLVESLGVPHPEIDLILIDGEPVDFAAPVPDGARIAVYPRLIMLDDGAPSHLMPPPPSPPRFVVDGHLGRLARYLRLLGFDTRYDVAADDPSLARASATEERLLLTQDVGLLRRSSVRCGYRVRASDPHRQLVEVARRYDLLPRAEPFRRCLRCNGLLAPVSREAVLDRLEPLTRRHYDRFWRCEDCGRVYWEGSHHRHLLELIAWLRGEVAPGAGDE